MTQTWSSKQGSRDRKAWLLVVTADGAVIPFAGASIPGKLAVVGENHTKDGKWSHTTYRLALADGVRLIAGRDGWDTGTFAEGLASATGAKTPPGNWAEMAAALGATVDSTKAFMRAWRPKAASKLDATEADVAALGTAVKPPPVTLVARVVNLTPHEVRVLGGAPGSGLYPPSGTVARVSVTREKAGTVAGMVIYRSTYGSVTDLPPESKWAEKTVYIVSAMVRLALPGRKDLFSPGELVRGADGQPVGCQGLEGNL